MEQVITERTIRVSNRTGELLDCYAQVEAIFGRIADIIGMDKEAQEADYLVDTLIAKPFEDFRFAIANLIAKSIADSLIEEGI